MKVRLGTHTYDARLRFRDRFQGWVIAVGPVILSRTGLEAQGASLCPGTALEERQIAEAGFAEWLGRGCDDDLTDVDRLAS